MEDQPARLEQLVGTDQKISKLETKGTEASHTYGPRHPVIGRQRAELAGAGGKG